MKKNNNVYEIRKKIAYFEKPITIASLTPKENKGEFTLSVNDHADKDLVDSIIEPLEYDVIRKQEQITFKEKQEYSKLDEVGYQHFQKSINSKHDDLRDGEYEVNQRTGSIFFKAQGKSVNVGEIIQDADTGLYNVTFAPDAEPLVKAHAAAEKEMARVVDEEANKIPFIVRFLQTAKTETLSANQFKKLNKNIISISGDFNYEIGLNEKDEHGIFGIFIVRKHILEKDEEWKIGDVEEQKNGSYKITYPSGVKPIEEAIKSAKAEPEKSSTSSGAGYSSRSSSSSNYYASDNEMAGAAGALAIGAALATNYYQEKHEKREQLKNGGIKKEEGISFSKIFSTSALVTGGLLLLDAIFLKGAGREKIVSTFKR